MPLGSRSGRQTRTSAASHRESLRQPGRTEALKLRVDRAGSVSRSGRVQKAEHSHSRWRDIVTGGKSLHAGGADAALPSTPASSTLSSERRRWRERWRGEEGDGGWRGSGGVGSFHAFNSLFFQSDINPPLHFSECFLGTSEEQSALRVRCCRCCSLAPGQKHQIAQPVSGTSCGQRNYTQERVVFYTMPRNSDA